MNAMELRKCIIDTETEADMLFVCWSPDTGTMQVMPFWEYDEDDEDMLRHLAYVCAKFADENGGGEVIGVYVDKRATI